MEQQVTSKRNVSDTTVESSWLNVGDTALFLRRSKSVVHKQWPSWVAYGVKPARYGGRRRGRLMFKRSEIEAMIEQWRIDTGA